MINSLQTKLIDKRKFLKMTQQELANKTGLSTRTIQRMESGKTTPQYHSLKRVMEVLQIDEENLFDNVDNHQDFKLVRRVIKWSVLLAVFVPINLIVLIILRIIHRNEFINNYLAQRVVGFQICWVILQGIVILAFPLISYLFTGQRINGLPVFLQLIYFITVVANIVFLIWLSRNLKVNQSNILNQVPRI